MPQAQTTTSTVNDRQVGGTHYRDSVGKCPACGEEIQHWDLFGMLPYLVGCATKYILRHRSKGGKQDLVKAIHYTEKIIEQEYPEDEEQTLHAKEEAESPEPAIAFHIDYNETNFDALVAKLAPAGIVNHGNLVSLIARVNITRAHTASDFGSVGATQSREILADDAEAARRRAEEFARNPAPGPTSYQQQFPAFKGEDPEQLKRVGSH